ncbi:hypothetical protein DV735_g3213, partial [Chaetothyriales sp. CBS 134920]
MGPQLGLRVPFIWTFSEIEFVRTLMSKRKIGKLIESGTVSGWDDPRLPTVRGIRRRGMTVEGLRDFMVSQGLRDFMGSQGLRDFMGSQGLRDFMGSQGLRDFMGSQGLRDFMGSQGLRDFMVSQGLRDFMGSQGLRDFMGSQGLRDFMVSQGLRDFMVSQGPSKNVVNMDWHTIWAMNKKVIDPQAGRYTAINSDLINGTVLAQEAHIEEKPRHAKYDLGQTQVHYGPNIVIEREDAEALKLGEEVTLMNWDTAIVKDLIHGDGKPGHLTQVIFSLNPGGDFKSTKKITWLCTDQQQLVPVELVEFDHLLAVDKLDRDEKDWEKFLTRITEKRTDAIADCNVLDISALPPLGADRRPFMTTVASAVPMATATPPSATTNGDRHDLPPPPPPPPPQPAKKAKAKKDKLSAEENAKLVQARLSQLEQEKTSEKTAQAEVDREVKKATRDLNELIKSVKDPLGRIDLLQQKYEELFADMKKLEREYAKTKKKSDQQQKDADKAKTEHNKTATMKDKLEKLCRELTKENKKVKDENKRLEESEKAANVAVNERLDEMLYDVQEVMNQKGTAPVENLHLELDELFKTRCKVLADQTELRELQFKTILRHKDAEIAHLAAKYEVERRRADTEAARCRTLTNQVSTFSHTEAELRSQLNIYVEKFKQQVEDTLNNSNELFLTFRKEMEEMSKKTKRLEKENLTLTRKHDQTNRNILEMAEERTRDKEDLERLRKQEQQMRSIIKTMQEQGRGVAPVDREDGERTEKKPVFGPEPPPDLGKGKGVANARRPAINGVAH